MKKPYIIAVSGISGSGKTYISNLLFKNLPDTRVIHFDDYPVTLNGIGYYEWSAQGADYDKWDLSRMAEDIDEISSEKPGYIIIDYPFGNRHSTIAEYIDYTIFINTPMDIALARKILRDYLHRDPKRKQFDNIYDKLACDLDYYILHQRKTYLIHEQTVKPYADYVVDGTLQAEQIVNLIINKIINL